MAFVISEACVDIKDKACLTECPVDCLYEGGRMTLHPTAGVHRLRRLSAALSAGRDLLRTRRAAGPVRVRRHQRRVLRDGRFARRLRECQPHRQRPRRRTGVAATPDDHLSPEGVRARMLSREENERMCRVGPGTAMGEVLRRYWIPVLRRPTFRGPTRIPCAYAGWARTSWPSGTRRAASAFSTSSARTGASLTLAASRTVGSGAFITVGSSLSTAPSWTRLTWRTTAASGRS